MIASGAAMGCALLLAVPAGAGDVPAPLPSVSGVIDRTVEDSAIPEDSALAISPTHDGLLWTLNDSGNPPIVFGVGPDGSTRVRLRVTGVPNHDWEALAAWRDPAGRALLAVGDIGDNGATRSEVEVDVLAEPTRLPPATQAASGAEREVKPLRRIRLRYPKAPADAETLLIDPRTQRMYLVTKGLFNAHVYRVPDSAWPGGSGAVTTGTLQWVGDLPFQLATDGTVLDDGRVVLRGYATASLLAPLPTDPADAADIVNLASVVLPEQHQGEGLTADADTIYLSSEGLHQPILRLRMPPSFLAALGPSGAATPSGGPSPGASGAASSGGGRGTAVLDDVIGMTGGRVGTVGGGFALLALVAALGVRRRRRSVARADRGG